MTTNQDARLAMIARLREVRCEIARTDLRLAPVHVVPDRNQIRDLLEFCDKELGAVARQLEEEVR